MDERPSPPATAELPPVALVTRVIARLPLPVRRRVVKGFFVASALLGRTPRAGLQGVFERVLRASGRDAGRLDRRAALLDITSEMDWIGLLLRSPQGMLRDFSAVSVAEDGAALLDRLAATGRPVMLAPLHMGAYVVALGSLMVRFFPGRPMLILRRRDDMPRETRVMERIRTFGIDMRFLNVSQRGDYLAAVRFARRGAVIVAFCDLPPSFGIPAPMPLFGLDTSFAFGLDGLARLTGAVVLPMASRSALGREEVAFGTPFEVGPDGGGERERAAGHIHRHLRAVLSETPEQWHLWPTLAEYLPAPAKAADAASLAEAAE